MTFVLAVLAAAGCASAASAQAAGGQTFKVTNTTARPLQCAVRKDGSARTKEMLLKPGQVWTESVRDRSDRRVRCEGVYSQWQRISAGRPYALVRAADGRLFVTPAADAR